MKTFTKALLATTAALAFSAAAATANAAVYISFDGVNTYASFSDDSVQNTLALTQANCTALGNPCGGYNNITVAVNARLDPISLLHSDTVIADTSGGGNVTIWVTRTGINFTPERFSWEFGGSASATGGYSIGYAAYYSTNPNALYSTANLIASDTRTASPYGTAGDTASTAVGPYSLTERFTLSSTGVASLQPDILVGGLGVVPEPSTWAMMIIGFGGAGALLRRRKVATA